MSEIPGASAAPPNWYPDPADAQFLRYWDGARWTEHTSPATGVGAGPVASASGGSSNKTLWIVLGSVFGVLLLLGLLAAIAIPVFLSQQAKAADTAAKADVSTLGKEIAVWFVDHDGLPPKVETQGGYYLVDGVPVAAVSPDVVLGGQDGTGTLDWCVWVRNPKGDIEYFEYSAYGGLSAGTC